MQRHLLFLFVILLSLWAGELAGWAATPDALTPVGSTQMPFPLVDGTYAVWSGGELVFVKDRFSSAPIVRFFDRNGTQVSEFTFRIPGAKLVNIYDNSVALGSDGSLAIVGTAYSDDSRSGTFVAWVSPDRKEQTVIRTSPFFPSAVTVASDGTIWVAGPEKNEPNEKRDYSRPLIRRYDKTGKLLGSFLPWSSVSTDPKTLPYAGSVLVTQKDRVLWYAPRSLTYFEFSSDGSVINRFRSAPHPQHDVTSVAACEDGGVFASTQVRSPGHRTQGGVFTLNRERGEWTLIPRNEDGRILGCDGTRLATTTDYKTISWLQPTAK